MSLEGVSVHLVECVDDAAELMRWLGERRPVLGFDTETEGFHWWRQNCRLAQFGDALTGWAIPFERWSGVVEEVFRRYDGPVVGHNIRFDARFMHHHGIDIGLHRTHDTMLAANALWPDERLALKTLASQRLDAHAADGESALAEAMSANHWGWATVPIKLPQYWAYGALDAILSARLYEQMDPMLDAQGLRHVYELECAVSNVLFAMETRGARIDVPYCEQRYGQLTEYGKQMRQWCTDRYHVSPGSNAEVVSYLQAAGYEFTKRTKSDKIALDEDVLSRIDHPLAQAVLYTRKAEKIASTYFANFLDLVDGDMLHCSVKQVGARTGRMSITEPALQTLPRDNKVVRNAFIPLPEHKLVSIDYSQIEMRIFAHFAQEEEMLKRIRSGMNMHEAVAAVLYHLPDGVKADPHIYGLVKNANFANVYGAGVAKFAWTAGITESEAKPFLDQYHSIFPGVKRFARLIEETSRSRFLNEGRAYVRAPSGRLHVTDGDHLYKLVNYLIQGTAADVLKEKLVQLDFAGFGDFMFLPIHDEVLFDFPADAVGDLSASAAGIMKDTESFSVPLDVSVSPPLERWEKS